MTNKLNKLTWKYFWKRKWEEVSFILLILFIVWSVAGLFFQAGWLCQNVDSGCGSAWGYDESCVCKIPYEPVFPYWMMYSGIITTGIWIIVGLGYWIKTNWKEAREEARKKLGVGRKIK